MKWGEHSSDVQFILQRSEGRKPAQPHQQIRQNQKLQHVPCNNNRITDQNVNENSDISLERHKNIRKSFTLGYVVSLCCILPLLIIFYFFSDIWYQMCG